MTKAVGRPRKKKGKLITIGACITPEQATWLEAQRKTRTISEVVRAMLRAEMARPRVADASEQYNAQAQPTGTA